jgi:hypothetical protein
VLRVRQLLLPEQGVLGDEFAFAACEFRHRYKSERLARRLGQMAARLIERRGQRADALSEPIEKVGMRSDLWVDCQNYPWDHICGSVWGRILGRWGHDRRTVSRLSMKPSFSDLCKHLIRSCGRVSSLELVFEFDVLHVPRKSRQFQQTNHVRR